MFWAEPASTDALAVGCETVSERLVAAHAGGSEGVEIGGGAETTGGGVEAGGLDAGGVVTGGTEAGGVEAGGSDGGGVVVTGGSETGGLDGGVEFCV